MRALVEAVLRSDYVAIKTAIAFDDDLNDQSSGVTPLQWAGFRGDVEAVRLSRERGADLTRTRIRPTRLCGVPKTILDCSRLREILKSGGAVK